MTFTEAAEAVLRKAGKPLHYKKITQFAIEQNLLSHVGKTPEVTMSTRLATVVKKDRGDAPILRVKPGVFGLRDWGENQTSDEPDDDEPALAEEGGDDSETPRNADEAAEDAREVTPEERERTQRLAAASQLFPVEDDDDMPVMGERPAPPAPAPREGAAAAGTNGGAAAGAAQGEGGRRRRRRRRRGRGGERVEGATGTLPLDGTGGENEFVDEGEEGDEEDDGDELLTPAQAGGDAAGPEGQSAALGGTGADGDVSSGESAREGGAEGAREPRRDHRRERRDERPDDRRLDETREETGRDAADLVVWMLGRREDRSPVTMRALVDEGLRIGRMSGDSGVLVAAYTAAVRADDARRESRGERPRLRIATGRVGLIDWAIGPELVRAEADALVSLERLRDTARRQVVRRLNELPQPAFVELLVMLLERTGVSSLRVTRRPGLPQGEIHLAGIARKAGEELKVAVVLKRGGEIGRERVIEMRGSLHHYGPALSAWMLTTGNVLSGAREEAAQVGAPVVNLVDAQAVGRLLDEHAIGIKHARVAVPYVDFDLFDTLRSGG